jgi:hypothetical protein
MKCSFIAQIFSIAVIACCARTGKTEPVTLNSLLQEMADRDALARFPSPAYRQLQGSTYNRASVAHNQPDQSFGGWFADGDASFYLRTENTNSSGTTEYVVMDHDGPGVITKLWTPFFYQSYDNRTGARIRIYLNGSNVPVIDENLIELVTRLEWDIDEYGSKPSPQNSFGVPNPISAFTARAGDCYLPIPFATRCKVTLSSVPFYDIVSYRAYEPGTVVETFTTNLYYAATNQAQLTLTAQQIGVPTNFSGGTLFQTNRTLAAGQAMALNLSSGASAVRHFEVQLDPLQIATNAAALRSTVVVMSFDGVQTVWCPVGDFFCSADSIHPFDTWTRSVTSGGQMVCRWVMPYQGSASIVLTNLGTDYSVTATLIARTGPWIWTSNSMHFHANWRPDNVVPGSPPSDWNFIDVQGQGVLVGDAWTVGNIQGGWWGEGDEKIYVDGEYETNKFPGIFGTGTEDYYGWAGGVNPTRTDEFSSPYLSNVRVGGLNSDTMGYNINTRVRALDAIPFRQRLVFDMESSFGVEIRNPWNILGYSSAVFWYATPGATHNRPPLPAEATKPILSMAQLQAISDQIRFGTNTQRGSSPGSCWKLGEQDPGAVAGADGQETTRDSWGHNELSKYGTPAYSASVPSGGSTLSMSFNGSDSYYQTSGTNLADYYGGVDFNRFGLSCDVYPIAWGKDGFSFPVSIGRNGGGLAIVEIGGAWHLIHQGVAASAAGPSVSLNTWTHLELQRRDFGSGVQTRLFINGSTTAACTINGAPSPPAPFFTIGANQLGGLGVEGFFSGRVDNVLLQNLNPVIVSGPVLTPNFGTLPAGGSFSLAILASGQGPLTFLWRRNGLVVTNTGSIPAVNFEHAISGQTGTYDVVITNQYHSVTSSAVSVTIVAADDSPVIGGPLSVSPSSAIRSGGSFTLSATGIGGASPLTFLWRRDGTVLTNTGSLPSVTFSDVATNQSGSYDLILTNPFGAATSSVTTITVLPPNTMFGVVKAWYRLGDADPGSVEGNPAAPFTVDEVGTNDLARFGSPLYTADVRTNTGRLAIAFNPGTPDWFTGNHLPIFSTLNLSNFSLSFDAKPLVASSYNVAVCLGRYGAGAAFIYMAGGTWRYHVGAVGDQITGGTAALNQWQQITFTRSNGVNALFVDGVQVGSTTNTVFPTPSPELSIGAAKDDVGAPDGLFAGLIDNVKLTDLSLGMLFRRPSLSLRTAAARTVVSVSGGPGFLHTLWRTSQLFPATWLAITNRVTNTSGETLLIDTLPLAASAIYRVSVP